MHRDDQRRLHRRQHVHDAVEIERVEAVDRRHDHVGMADLVELLLGQRMVQVAQMNDAQIGDLENKD
jgi:hypothetical protein